MSPFTCILCLKEITKDYERFLVQSKKTSTALEVNSELAGLDFIVYSTSDYICRQCHGRLKKRKSLIQNIQDIEQSLRRNYATSLAKVDLAFNPKQSPSPGSTRSKRPRTEELQDQGEPSSLHVNTEESILNDSRELFATQPVLPLHASTPVKIRPNLIQSLQEKPLTTTTTSVRKSAY